MVEIEAFTRAAENDGWVDQRNQSGERATVAGVGRASGQAQRSAGKDERAWPYANPGA